ncbi:MAG: beta-N-acetylhexosaminidase [Clostridia bacterium]|nr:beta-N-acetylhexosaminidase [Clostridia bacterium]
MRILPRPQKAERVAGQFVIDEQTTVFCHPDFQSIAEQFVAKVNACSGLDLQFCERVEENQIHFVLEQNDHAEGYKINISQTCLTVSAGTKQGCFYAMQSLCQLFDLHIPHQQLSTVNYYVEDYPKFAHRGQHLDICRHFFGVETIKQVIDLMSEVKLNKLHLHLSDDQGFRVQIDKYPLLTEIGSVRGGSEVVRDGQRFVDETPHSGFLTKADVAEIVSYASERFIDVIPEIDIPGHMVAALAAYPEYSCTGKVTEVRQKWGISKDILCAGNEEGYQFVCDILDEICDMFPYEYIHLGGDEAPKDRWCNCPKCVEKMAELKYDSYAQLQNYMLEFFVSYLNQAGKKVIVWNDGIHAQTSMEVVSQVWKPLTRNQGIKQANAGRPTIMSPFFHMYFDYPYGMTPFKKTLKFNPLKGVKKHAKDNVLGVEGALWTEYIEDTNKLFFNFLPRLDALANVAWSGIRSHFNEALAGRFAHYDQLGLNYNSRAPKQRRSLRTINRFFKVDSYTEIHDHQKYLEKQQQKKDK